MIGTGRRHRPGGGSCARGGHSSASDKPGYGETATDGCGGCRGRRGVTVDAPCFIQPLRRNAALDGPLPTCSRQ
jgi:hypothetical protein